MSDTSVTPTQQDDASLQQVAETAAAMGQSSAQHPQAVQHLTAGQRGTFHKHSQGGNTQRRMDTPSGTAHTAHAARA